MAAADEMEPEMGSSAEDKPHPRPSGGHVSVDELALRKGVQPIRSADDLACDGIFETDEELARLLAAGARPVEIGQSGEESWQVLADPEGNEFCLLRRRVDPT
jgi:hypothetical protein